MMEFYQTKTRSSVIIASFATRYKQVMHISERYIDELRL